MSVDTDRSASGDRTHVEVQTGRRLVCELDEIFGGETSRAMVSGYVYAAISDLRGSVSAEALPEMAARLARHRLLDATEVRQSNLIPR